MSIILSIAVVIYLLYLTIRAEIRKNLQDDEDYNDSSIYDNKFA